MSYLDILRANLGAELGRRGWPHKAAADALGVTKGTLSAKLNGRTSVKLEELVKLAEWLEVPFSTLVDGFDDEIGRPKREEATAA